MSYTEEEVMNLIEAAVRSTWRKAATEVNNCRKHYPEGGDPNGCLEGLACEFSANADGDGPACQGDSDEL